MEDSPYLDSIVPRFITGDAVEIVVGPRDVVLKRKRKTVPYRQRLRDRKKRAPVAPKQEFSRKARLRMLVELRNSTCYVQLLTLTFGYDVGDDHYAKKCLDLFLTWAVRRPASLRWKQEFGVNLRPHFHLLSTRFLERDSVRGKWGEITCYRNPMVHAEPIRDCERVLYYVVKPYGDRQNLVPPGYRNMGNFQGRRGPDARPDVLLHVRGDPKSVGPVSRGVKGREKGLLREKGKRTKPKSDKGFVGRVFYDCGGSGVAGHLQRVCESIGLQRF